MCQWHYRAFIFDFDGVILDAVPVRTEAFLHVLRDFPQESLEIFKEYHLKNGGISRFEKIRYFFREIVQQPLEKDKEKLIFDAFGVFVQERLRDRALLIQDTLSFIQEHYQQYPLFIASGSQQDELRALCDFFGIQQYFRCILGSPVPKAENVAFLVKAFDLCPQETVLIGDSFNDFVSARASLVDFLGYNNPELYTVGQGYIERFSPLKMREF